MLSIIAARSLNNVIGDGSEIPWHVEGEQKLFKEITMNGTQLMGRKTFEAIGRPLPGRTTVIITRRSDYQPEGCIVAHSLNEAMEIARQRERPTFIAGGGEIYRQSLDLVDAIHLSTIQITVKGDVFFPEFPTSAFRLAHERLIESNIDYIYQYYERIEIADSTSR